MANREWKKNLGFLESIMFDPVTSGILGGLQGIMGMFQTGEQNRMLDEASDSYRKLKLTEDQMARRESNVKRQYGSMVDSMIGAGQYLNSDTARAMTNAKLTGQSMEAQLKQKMADEQRNLQIDDQINKIQSQKKGYLEGVAGTLGGALQGVFSATQSSMLMDEKEKQNKLLEEYMGGKSAKQGINSTPTTTTPASYDKTLRSVSQVDPIANALYSINQYQNNKDREQYMLDAMKLKTQLGVTQQDITSMSQNYYSNLEDKNYHLKMKPNLPIEKQFYFDESIPKLQGKKPWETVIQDYTRTGELINNDPTNDYLQDLDPITLLKKKKLDKLYNFLPRFSFTGGI